MMAGGLKEQINKQNTNRKTTLTAYSISLFSHEQLCNIATAPVKINTRNKKTYMNKCVSTYDREKKD